MLILARMYYGDESAYVSLSSGKPSPALGTEKFLDILSADPFPEVAQELDMLEHTHSIQNLQLMIDNLEFEPGKRWSDLVEDTGLGAGADIGFYNRRIDIRAYLPDVTTFANCFPLFSNGIVRDIKHTREKTTINIEDRSEIANIDIGTYLTDSDAADTGQGLPENSQGKIRPEIWGDHRFYRGDDSKALDTASEISNPVPSISLGVDSSGNPRWFIAGNKMDSLSVSGLQVELWAKDRILNRFVRLFNDATPLVAVEQNTSSGCIISHNIDPKYLDYVYAVDSTAGKSGDGVTNLLPIESVHDKDFSTASSGDMDNDVAAISIGDYMQIATTYWREWENQGLADTGISNVDLFYYGKLTYANGAADGDIKVKMAVGALVVWTDQTTKPSGASYPDARIINDSSHISADKTGISTNAGIRLEAITNFTGTEKVDFDIYEIYKQITYTPGEIYQLFFAGKGVEYGTWINDRAVGDGYTEEHEDHNEEAGSDNAIENFAGVIESVLRDLISLGNTEIDRDTFNIASNDVPAISYKCSTSLTERIPARDFLFSLCKDSQSWIWWQTDGTIKMKVMIASYTSSDRVLDARDITGLEFDRTPIYDIKTAVDVRYNLSEGRYMSAAGISEDTDQQTKYNITEAQSTLIHEAPNIGDSATAINLRTFLLRFFKQPHNIAIGTLDKMHLDLDVGDIIEFSNVPYKVYGEDVTANATRNGQTIYKYWWVFKVARSDVMRFEAIQLHDLS